MIFLTYVSHVFYSSWLTGSPFPSILPSLDTHTSSSQPWLCLLLFLNLLASPHFVHRTNFCIYLYHLVFKYTCILLVRLYELFVSHSWRCHLICSSIYPSQRCLCRAHYRLHMCRRICACACVSLFVCVCVCSVCSPLNYYASSSEIQWIGVGPVCELLSCPIITWSVIENAFKLRVGRIEVTNRSLMISERGVYWKREVWYHRTYFNCL